MKCSLSKQQLCIEEVILFVVSFHTCSLSDSEFTESGKRTLRQAAEARKEQSNFSEVSLGS